VKGHLVSGEKGDGRKGNEKSGALLHTLPTTHILYGVYNI